MALCHVGTVRGTVRHVTYTDEGRPRMHRRRVVHDRVPAVTAAHKERREQGKDTHALGTDMVESTAWEALPSKHFQRTGRSHQGAESGCCRAPTGRFGPL